jgi:hypothetical protein
VSAFDTAAVLVSIAVMSFARSAAAQGDDARSPPVAPVQEPEEPPPPALPPLPVVSANDPKPSFTITPTGYVEAYYAYNFRRPSNGITNYRGFDNRHNTFSLANVAVGATFAGGPLTARLILQVGSTPSTYYGGEPLRAGASGANATGPDLWKYVQEAHVGYKAPVGRGLLVEGGLFPSPCGLEVFAIKDNWNWSRSNLFFALPYYHTGLRLTYEWTPELSTSLFVVNGWSSVVDNNEAKSLMPIVAYKIPDRLAVQAMYLGGVERPKGAPEGPYWRHHFDLFGQYDATKWLSLLAQADYGWEPNRFGTARWAAGAVYARVKPIERVYVALRGDRFHEHLATDNPGGRSSTPIFWGGVEWVSSGTATLDVRPHEQLSVRLEYRHDVADTPLYFGRDVRGDGSAAAPFAANARTQDTALLGATGWF